MSVIDERAAAHAELHALWKRLHQAQVSGRYTTTLLLIEHRRPDEEPTYSLVARKGTHERHVAGPYSVTAAVVRLRALLQVTEGQQPDLGAAFGAAAEPIQREGGR